MIETPINDLGTKKSSRNQDWLTKYERPLHTSKKVFTMAVSSNAKSLTYWFIKNKGARVRDTTKHEWVVYIVFLHFAYIIW